jgi:D-alanine-D-alanine ligase
MPYTENTMDRKTILLIFGGESSEHDVSVSSARNVYAAIDDTKFTVLLGYIDRQGKWWLLDKFGNGGDTHGAPQFAPVLGAKSFVTFPGSRVVRPDVILPILHGKNGEDGSVQGMAQLLHIPIVGCLVTASAICMDKIATKRNLQASDVAVAPYEVYWRGFEPPVYGRLVEKLGTPLFVKPARAGSSVGVSKVTNAQELDHALEVACKEDDMVLIEQAIAGRELEVAVLGNPPDHQTSGVGEIKLEDGFYDYDAKYDIAGASLVGVRADIPAGVAAEVRQTASKAYDILGCQGLARVDFFLGDDGTVYINEVNTLPGFTNISMYPRLWREEGVSYGQLIERLISLALEKSSPLVKNR